MKLLDISRATLFNYTRDGKIKVIRLDNGYYDYNEESVFKIIKKDARINVIYSRVSTYKQKTDLENQIYKINAYCQSKNIQIGKTYSDINSGLDLDRTGFNSLMDDVINLKIKNIYILHIKIDLQECLLKLFNIYLVSMELILLLLVIINNRVIYLMIMKFLRNLLA